MQVGESLNQIWHVPTIHKKQKKIIERSSKRERGGIREKKSEVKEKWKKERLREMDQEVDRSRESE